jgi:hypothetical protein
LSPGEEWRAIGNEAPEQWSIFGSFVLPLACIPAAGWSVKLFLFGGEGGRDGEAAAIGLAQVLQAGLTVWVCSVLSVFVLASSVYALAPLFVRTRDWPRALQVAAYSSAPVLLGGAILAIPDLAYMVLLAAFQTCYVMYAGLKCVLDVKEDNAAEYVALSIVLLTIVTTLLGALGGALGML